MVSATHRRRRAALTMCACGNAGSWAREGAKFVRPGEGVGRSKLAIPATRQGTARNTKTIAKLVELAGG